MAYREGNQNQVMMFPPSFDELIDNNDPVRLYNDFVEHLDVESLGLHINNNKEGNPQYHPKAMLKLLLYGYSYGIRSSRRLERAVYHNITFIWLVGGLKPDHKTIALFRKRNKRVLKQVFKQCVTLCIDLNVIEGNTLYVDGSKIRGNAGIKHSYTKKQASSQIHELEKKINRMLKDCDHVDKSEKNQGSWVKLNQQLETAQKRKNAIEATLKQIEKEERSINLTDPDTALMKGRQGSHSGYNAQVVCDDAHGLIVSNDVVNQNNDSRQLEAQVEKVQSETEITPKTIVADKGYFNLKDIQSVHGQGIDVVIPEIKCASNKKQAAKFDKTTFTYDPKINEYRCPENHVLKQESHNKNGARSYVIHDASICQNCSHFGTCTTSQSGRKIQRHEHESHRERARHLYQSESGQETYRKRGYKVEPIFGHIKRNMGVSSFLVRGLEHVQSEFNIIATTYNLTRLITLFGVTKLRSVLNPA